MIRGWYDIERGIACVSAGALGFSGTHAQFLERCRRMDANRVAGPGADSRGATPDHPEARDWTGDCHQGWDANGSPVEAA